jgi:pseudaminic acid synthase
MSANHKQDFDKAKRIIEQAKKAGADAIKLQTYRPDTITIDCDSQYFQTAKGTIEEGQSLYDLYREAYMPWEWQPKLKKIADDIGIDLFSTPFDHTAVDFLERMEVPAYKIASFEIVDIPLIEKIASTGKPVIMSTGMASLSEIEEAVNAVRSGGNCQLALLKCTSAYPSMPKEMNLRTIPHLAKTFHVPAGLSDHCLGSTVSVAAVALGACIIEKHFTLSRAVPGPDSEFSLEPNEFEEMVKAIRVAEKALGDVSYQPTQREKVSKLYRKSLFVIDDIKKGELLTERNIKSIRPGYGLHPRYMQKVLGRRVIKNVKRGMPLRWELLD